MFEITLMIKKTVVRMYFWYVIPDVGDRIILSEDKVFRVKECILPTEGNSVIIMGEFV